MLGREPGSVGAGDGDGVGDGEGGLAGASVTEGAATGGGDSGGAGGAGRSAEGEASISSSDAGGIEGGDVVGGGVSGGGVAGVAGQERGESKRSFISFCLRSSSASFCRLLTRLAGGDATTGGKGGGGVEVLRGGGSSQAGAAAVSDDGCGRICVSRLAVVAAARPRLVWQRRRLFLAGAADVVEAGRVHVTVTV
jgi:hypothetical protein